MAAESSLATLALTRYLLDLSPKNFIIGLSSSADPRNLPKGIRFTRYPSFGPAAVLTKSGEKPSLARMGIDY